MALHVIAACHRAPPCQLARGVTLQVGCRDGGAVLGNAAHDEQQYEAVVRTARALLAEGKVQEASQLAHRSVAAFGSKDRWGLSCRLALAGLLQHRAWPDR